MKMCERELEVITALRTGEWPAELRAHFSACEDCAETAIVTGFLLEAAATAATQVPEGSLVWWKAQLRARREAAEQAARPIVLAERWAAVAAVLSAVWALAWMSKESSTAAVAAMAAVVLLAVATGGVLAYAWHRK